MHADRLRWLTWMLAGCLFVLGGCQGTNRFGQLVQIRQDPNAAVPEFEPPRQRLATTKPRAGSPAEFGQDGAGQTTGRLGAESLASSPVANASAPAQSPSKPPVSRSTAATTASKSSPTSTGPTSTSPTSTSPTSTSPTSTNTASTNAATPRSAASPAEMVASPTRAMVADKPLQSVATPAPKTQMPAEQKANSMVADQDDLLQAFQNSPPEVQEQAMRQLIAAIARTAESTAHPEALEGALAASLNDLPQLPAESNVPATVPPNRLAAEHSERGSPKAAIDQSGGDQLASREPPVPANVASRESKPKSTQPTDEPMVATSQAETAIVQAASTQADVTEESKVQPVSAAHENSDPAMFAQAAVAPAGQAAEAKLSPDQLSDQQLYDLLLRRLMQAPAEETEAQRSRRLIMSRHLMVLAGDPDRAVAEIKDLGPEEQEYLRHQLLGLWTIIDPEGHPVPSRRFTTALPQLREATKYLAAATDSLEVQSLAFCTEIEAYGQIKRFPGNRFDAGQQVILYCEIENFTVTTVDGGYETHLQGSYDIFDANNEKVISQLLPADRQISSNYLRDYFIAYQMNLPKQLTKGAYRLQLTMEDVAGKKYGQASIPLDIK